MLELWDLYNAHREKIGVSLPRGAPIPLGCYHLVVSIWIRNLKGQYLISQRHPCKPYPLFWECTGGSALTGEDSLQAAIREVKEELGFVLDKSGGSLIYQERRENTQDFYDVWMFKCDFDIDRCILQEGEVISVQWASKKQILELQDSGKLHPLLSYVKKIIP